MAHFKNICAAVLSDAEGASIHVRILLAGMSKMLANIAAAALALAPDIVVVGAAREDDDVAGEIRATHADAVVTQVGQPQNSEAFHPLLLGFPALKVIAIADDGSSGFVHELRLASTRLAELSSATLQAALRGEPPERTH
jgi:DNA-binding NarL/FixJ family response regulator